MEKGKNFEYLGEIEKKIEALEIKKVWYKKKKS